MTVADNPFVKPITDVSLVQARPGKVIILERVEPGVTPAYCIHGKTTCFKCNDWCWLGSETYKMVRGGEATPLCMQCAIAFDEEHPGAFGDPIANAGDRMGHE